MSNHVATYPTDEQLSRWEAQVEDMDISLSEWVQSMVVAGQKNFTPDVQPDESVPELREQRNDLREQLAAARSRIERLETRLYEGEREAIAEYVAENPGAEYDEVIQHVIDTAPARVTRQLDALEGERLSKDGDAYYPVTEEDA